MFNTAPALEENWWQVLNHSFIKKKIYLWPKLISSNYDEAYLADLFWQNWQINICVLFGTADNAYIADF